MIKCEKCGAPNHNQSAYCFRCSQILPLQSKGRDWKAISFWTLAIGFMFCLVASVFITDEHQNFLFILAKFMMSLAVLAGLIFLFILPTFIAARRRHHNTVPIVIVNIVFGITFIGWIIALIWACTAVNHRLDKL